MTPLQLIALSCLTGVAAVVDARTGKIPNRLNAVGLAAALSIQVGLALHALDHWTAAAVLRGALDALGTAALGLLACASAPLVLYARGAFGGGDVKILAVTGALLSVGPGLELMRAALLAAVCFALLQRVFQRRARPPLELARASSTLESRLGPPLFVAACYLTVSHWPSQEARPQAADATRAETYAENQR